MRKPNKETTPCETSTEFDNFKELTAKLLKVKPEELQSEDKPIPTNKNKDNSVSRSKRPTIN